MQGPASSPLCHIPEDIVIIEDDVDDDESIVRSVQMAEDEAYAKSLQVRLALLVLIEQH